MSIKGKPETEAWLEAQVAAGHFADISEVLDAVVMHYQLTVGVAEDESLSWANPYLNAAEEDVRAGRVKPTNEIFDKLETKLACK